MIYRKKKTIPKNKYAACVLSAFFLAGVLSGCAGNGGDGAGGGESPDGSSYQAQDQEPGPQVSEEEAQEDAVAFEGQDIEGNAVTSDIFGQSRLTMINVWATYCNPCLIEMPELGELAGEYEAGDFQLIGVISDVPEATKGMDAEKVERAVEEAKSLIEMTGADYPHLLVNVSLYNALLTDVTAVPTTFFIDGEGKVLDTVVGARDKDSWRKLIDALLEDL
ncbi:MAG: TlpA family protein disulfide reductase [Lachnospiraceae bacterium]|nr:TlpA disulfide reductase family protein [uncultured Acetatifactor sp.]MCI9573009.1 TlpA family protein disulfide reductase [Lachnospiraceae bacterium]